MSISLLKHSFTVFSLYIYANIYDHIHIYTQKLMMKTIHNIYNSTKRFLSNKGELVDHVFSVTPIHQGGQEENTGEKAINQ